MTRDEIALLLDPARERDGWWECRYVANRPVIGKPKFWLDPTKKMAPYMQKLCDAQNEWRCTAPDFETNDLAAFRWLRPVLRKVRHCYIEDGSLGALVYFGEEPGADEVPWINYNCISPTDDDGAPLAYAAACVAAFAHLAQHEPETLARAVQEVRDAS